MQVKKFYFFIQFFNPAIYILYKSHFNGLILSNKLKRHKHYAKCGLISQCCNTYYFKNITKDLKINTNYVIYKHKVVVLLKYLGQ